MDGTRKTRLGGMLLALLALAALPGACAGEPEDTGTAVFPLPQRYAGSYTNDWGAPRPQGPHEGTDIFAPEGTPVYAITGGTVVAEGWNTLGGHTVTIAAAYDVGPVREGDRLYYAHLRTSSPLEPGEEVRAGQKIGEVGRTAGEEVGSVADFPPHLHLGWYEGFRLFRESRAQAPSGAMNPYPLLRQVAG
ncbi:M23 family metallopeptidase [Rubrobacter xylanophilus]|uniref:M23 family metallopeptidase n=1 Tax=Rubrobacter xylanophilus TaxID=49319 RepID=UPI001C640A5B|nr:M23 family metallopeptidase [Rubrobacter xylanophilus]